MEEDFKEGQESFSLFIMFLIQKDKNESLLI